MNLKGLFSVAFFRILTALIAFFLILLLMHFLSIEQFAKFSFYYTYFTFCGMLPNIGVNNYFVLNNSSYNIKSKAINSRFYLFIGFILFVFCLYYLEYINSVLFFCSIAGILSSVFDMELSFKQASKDLKLYSYFMPIKTIIVFIVSLFTLLSSDNYVENVFYNLFIVFFIIFLFWLIFNINKNFFKIKSNLSIYLMGGNVFLFEFGSLLMARAEVFILAFYERLGSINSLQLANFWSSYNFILIISMLGTTLSSVVLPYIKESNKDYTRIDYIVKNTLYIMIFLVFIVTFVAYILGNFFIIKYADIWLYILCMSVGVCFSFLNNIDRMKIVSGSGSNYSANLILVLQLLLSIFLNFFLIYFYGVWGAIITFVFIRIFAWYFMKKEVVK